MQVSFLTIPTDIDSTLEARIKTDLTTALNAVRTVGDRFVVNDGKFFWMNPQGRLMPSVVNSAKFISGHFQNALQSAGWVPEKTIEGQRIDAYVELPVKGEAYSIPHNVFPKALSEYLRIQHSDLTGVRIDREASRLFGQYVLRTKFQISTLPSSVKHLFQRCPIQSPIRVGLEFETGNIASSFRALRKLEDLFIDGHIDLAVFIASTDKSSSATRIWPTTNRNGSFEELGKRSYANNRTVPTFDVGFSPDAFDRAAPFLGENLQTYTLTPTNETVTEAGAQYRIWNGPVGKRYQLDESQS